MKRLLQFLLNYQLKYTQRRYQTSGFTLIELLVGLVLAFLIITPLLGFVVNMMNTDRQEQAKSSSEQDIQAALNYIARDLDQAVYIYDGWGLNRTNTQVLQNLPYVDTKHVPVLVFWKRYLYSKALPTGGANCNTNPERCNDAFVNSLVVYYLIDNSDCSNATWACTERIGRVEIRDGVPDPTNPPDPQNPGSGAYVIQRDPGFVPLPDAASDVETQMNAWPGGATPAYNANTTPPIQTLIDYVDQTAPGAGQNVPQASCPNDSRPLPRPDAPRFATSLFARTPYAFRQVPADNGGNPVKSSFYACVSSDLRSAEIFIRGNALARLSPRRPNQTPSYVAAKSSYFPQANIRVKAGGLLTNKQS